MKKIMLCVVCLLCVSGCATMRQSVIGISEEEIENAKALRVVAKNYLSITAFQVGMIRGNLGERINELPKTVVDAIDELSALAALDPNSLTDEQLGVSLGLRLRLLNAIVQAALEIYAPDILKYLVLI